MKVKLDSPIFKGAIPVLKKIESHGFEAYFVGGCVRDLLLGKEIHDIDIASSALPEEIESLFRHTIDLGKEHGTIIVVENHTHYEITTFRTESNYSDFRHPDTVKFVRNLREDTLRRDFTINALALNKDGEVFDFHHGQDDLKQQLIRAVGNPLERFSEDALRIVRAIRFASQLDFKIEEKTMEAIQELAALLPNIAIERIRIELNKFFMGQYFVNHWQLLTDSLISNHILAFNGYDLSIAMKKMASTCNPFNYLNERLVWFLLCDALEIKEDKLRSFLRKWNHSNQLIQDVVTLYDLYPKLLSNKLSAWDVYKHPIDLVLQLEDYLLINQKISKKTAGALYDSLPIYSKADIVVNGGQILHWLNLEKGNQRFGQLMNKIEWCLVNQSLTNNQEAIKRFALENY